MQYQPPGVLKSQRAWWVLEDNAWEVAGGLTVVFDGKHSLHGLWKPPTCRGPVWGIALVKKVVG